MNRNVSRRAVLRGAGATLALPWFESLAPRLAHGQEAPPPRSFIAMSFPCGVGAFWKPPATGVGDAWRLSPILAPLAPVKSHVTVLQNVGNYGPFGGHVEPSHGELAGAFLTCTPRNVYGLAVTRGQGMSVDQVIAKSLGGATPIPSLQLGLSTTLSSPDGVPAHFSRLLSWAGPEQPLAKVVNPQKVFDRLVSARPMSIVPASSIDLSAVARRAANKSVLDHMRAHATTVRGQLGRRDQARLDDYLTSVRELEVRIKNNFCAGPSKPTESYEVDNVPADYDRNVHADLMIDLIVMALRCDLTRVVSFMFDDSRSDFVYRFLDERAFSPTVPSASPPAKVGSLHGLSAAPNDNNGWATINHWFVQKLARLCTKLHQIQHGPATLLDSTTIFFGSEMDGQSHDGLNLPLLFVGRGGNRLLTDRNIDFAATPRKAERLANLYLTFIRHVFGLPVTVFGEGGPPPTTPPLYPPFVAPNAYGAGTDVIPEIVA